MFGNRVFRGEQPRLDPRLLPEDASARARNCWLRNGVLDPLPELADLGVAVPAGTKTLYRFDADRFFAWSTDVDAVPAPVRNDSERRTIWTGDGAPKQTSTVIMQGHAFAGAQAPPVHRLLGIPAPTVAPSAVTQPLANADDEADDETHTWVYTFVSDQNEEGPPSPPSAPVDRGFDADGNIQTVRVGMDVAPTGAYGISHKRLYRSTTAGTYQLLAEVAVAAASYDDSKITETLGSGIESTNYDPPPAALAGLTALPNGVLAGFVGRNVYLSEPYQPHAWPADYIQVVNSAIVGLAVFGTTIVVCTEGQPYLIDGTDPAGAVPARQELDQACVAKRSITRWGEQGIVYACPDGLVLVGPPGGAMITESTFDRSQWEALDPGNIRAVFHDDAYLAFLDGSMVAFSREFQGIVRTADDVDAVLEDRANDWVLVVQDGRLKRFSVAGGAPRTLDWTCREQSGRLRTYDAGQVIAEAYPVTMQVTATGGNAIDVTLQVLNENPFRLPPLPLARHWQYRVEARAKVLEARIGTLEEML